MKEIIDGITGEIVEVEEKNEIALRQLNELGVNFEQYLELEERMENCKEMLDMWKYEAREKIKQVLEENGLKNVRVADHTISYVPAGVSHSVDTERMKEDGIYNNYVVNSVRKAYIKITKPRGR